MQNSKIGYKLFPKSLLRPSIGIGIITFLLVGGISLQIIKRFPDAVNQQPQISTKKLPTIKTVTALGRLEPKGKVIKLSATMSTENNRVEQLLVKEGEQIKKGQVIAILDNRDRLKAAFQEAQAQVKVAQTNLAKIQAGAKKSQITAQIAVIARLKAESQSDIAAQIAAIAKLQAQVQNATTENKRYQQLYQAGAISASQQDNQRLILETALHSLQEAKAKLQRLHSASQQQLTEATANLEQITEIRPVDVAQAQAEIERTQAALNLAKTNLQQAEVRSPQDGQILEIHTRPGEIIASDGIVSIGQTSQMQVIAEVYESDISKVHPGQKVRILNDFLPNPLQGTVNQLGLQVRRQNVINTDPSSNIDSRVIEVQVQLDTASSQQTAKLTNMQVKVVIQL
nr:ABC exporter membrane fusion protein [Fortiea contorta]